MFGPKGDFFSCNVMNLCFTELVGDFSLAVIFRHGSGAKKQKPAGPLTLQSITGGCKAKFILCLAQKDMCQIFTFLDFDKCWKRPRLI